MSPLTLVALPVVGILLIFTTPVIMTDFEDIKHLIEEHYKFAIELHHVMRNPNKNLVFSPITIQIMLALTFVGAKGGTKIELANTVHLPDNMEAVLDELKLIIEYLRDPALDLNFVATMFLEKSLKVKTRFLDRISKYFQSNVAFTNFKSDPEGSREEINQWIDWENNHKFIDFLDEGAINSDTGLFPTSAFFFKKEWETQFDITLPDSDFYITPDNKVKVTMLFQNEMFPYKHLPELKAKILELPYEDRDFKMIVILPDEINGLTEIENKLPTLNLTEIVASFDEVYLNIKLPIFKIEETTNLIGSLKKLGIKDLFNSETANLKGIAKNLYTSAFDHKVILESETEIYPFSGQNIHKEDFIADHPFIFFIYHNKVPLMIGSINGLE